MYNTEVFPEPPTSLGRRVRGAGPARRRVQRRPRSGLRRADLHRRRGHLPEGDPAGPRHRGPLRAQPGAVRRGDRPPAQPAATLVSRYWHDYVVQIEDFTNEGDRRPAASWPFQVEPAAADEQPIASVIPEEGATGWADTTMLARQRPAPELRLPVDGALARPHGAGRRRCLVRLRAGRAAPPARATSCSDRRGLQYQRLRQLRPDRVLEDARGRLLREAGGECVPYTTGSTQYLAIIGGN